MNNKKQEKSTLAKNKIGKLLGYGSIAGLIGTLSFVFLTKDGFSNWKEQYYQPKNNSQDISINENKSNIISNKDLLMRIDRNQLKILGILMRK